MEATEIDGFLGSLDRFAGTVSTLEEDRRALKEANEVLGQRIADLEREVVGRRYQLTRYGFL